MQKQNKLSYYLLKYKVFLIFIALFIVMCFVSDFFLTKANILNMLRQLSINGLLAVGMTFVLITGGIDLSVGSILTISAMVGAMFLTKSADYPIIVGIAAALGVGLMIGLLNGILIAKCKVPAFIVTLGTQLLASGGALLYNNGSPIPGLKDSFNVIGAGTLMSIPYPVIIFTIAVIVGIIILKNTRFGRYVYAIGGNDMAAKACGIGVSKINIAVYVISGFCAAISGIVLAARVRTATPLAGEGYELDAIAAVVLGGTSLTGGIGSIGGTIIGVLIIGLLNNGMDLLNIQSYVQDMVQGAIIIIAVLVDVNTNKSKN